MPLYKLKECLDYYIQDKDSENEFQEIVLRKLDDLFIGRFNSFVELKKYLTNGNENNKNNYLDCDVKKLNFQVGRVEIYI